MHELKETQVERQFLLRNAAMRSQPGAQQRLEALGGVHMNLMETTPIVIVGVFAPAMTHSMVVETSFRQPVVNVVFVGVHSGSGRDELRDQRLDRHLLDVLQHPDHDRPAALDHPEDRRFFAFQGPALLSGAAAGLSAPFFHRLRMPLMPGHPVDLVAFHVPRQDRFRLAADDPVPELFGHPLDVVWVHA